MTASPVPAAASRPARSARGERTRERIYASAVDLFAHHGYSESTMRMVADRAGVNVALSYRYFPSKEHLVLEFYTRYTRDLVSRGDQVRASGPGLEARLIGVAEAMFETAAPYRAFASSLFETAASPASPLNPFGREFGEIRRAGIALFERLLIGSRPHVPSDSAAELAFVLWTFNLGLMYCWIHDKSEGQQTTRLVLRESCRLIVQLLRFSGLPGARNVRRHVVTLTRLVLAQLPEAAA